ncbi:monooxygenase 2-like [Pistacia vera]|uniref:monooxygenase 2-like n=1 Tax=Pistacia vera TaxID=55513 RepID=UPI001262E6C4|nr:monooxygenase 2-like [Pistacia vera]
MAVEDVVVVGAGIAELATSMVLKRAGIRALFTFSESPSKRAIITDLGTGAEKEIKFTTANKIVSEPRTIKQKTLLEELADELSIESIRFSSKVAAIETQTQEGSSIVIPYLDDGTIIKTKVLIGCGGVHSMVAQWLGLGAAVSAGRSAVRDLSVFLEGHGSLKFQQYVDVSIRAGFISFSDKEVYWFFTCTQSISKGNVLHAMTPELAQGGAIALEDIIEAKMRKKKEFGRLYFHSTS